MIFVDTNVVMYAVGREHALREPAREFFDRSIEAPGSQLVTSTEVIQELLHAYLPVQRLATFDAAVTLVDSAMSEVWSLDAEDIRLARSMAASYPALGARDLVHLASCRRRGVSEIKTFDRSLASAFPG